MQLTEKDWTFLDKLNNFMEISRLDDEYLNLFFGKYLKHNYPELEINVISGYVNLKIKNHNEEYAFEQSNEEHEYPKNVDSETLTAMTHEWLEIKSNDEIYLLDLNIKNIFSEEGCIVSIEYRNSQLTEMQNLLFNDNVDKFLKENKLEQIEFSTQSNIYHKDENCDDYLNLYCGTHSIDEYVKNLLTIHSGFSEVNKRLYNHINNVIQHNESNYINSLLYLQVYLDDNYDRLFNKQINTEYLKEIKSLIINPASTMEDTLDALDLSESKKHKFKI